jgi:hypothetical protein
VLGFAPAQTIRSEFVGRAIAEEREGRKRSTRGVASEAFDFVRAILKMAREPVLHVFVDNANVLIEARRFAEMKRKAKARLSPYVDGSYEIDWGKFLYVLGEKDTRGLAEVPYLYGSRPPPDDTVWKRIRDDGFDVKVFDRNIRNKEKGVDMEMGMDVAGLLHSAAKPKILVIVAGDADSFPSSNALRRRAGRSKSGSGATPPRNSRRSRAAFVHSTNIWNSCALALARSFDGRI